MSGRPFDWRSPIVQMTVIRPDFACPRGHIINKSWGQLMHPSDWLARRHGGGRTPLFTTNMLGVKEAERDQRHQANAPRHRIICEPPTVDVLDELVDYAMGGAA